jgi:acyl-CoA synthetase (AMP-forming)/AMP-acid ligase II
MREQLGDSLARYKIPRYLVQVDELPMTPSGKIQKFKLRDRWIAEHREEPAAR